MINSLTARIFMIFSITIALVVMLVLMLPHFDSRQITSLNIREIRQGEMIEHHVEEELSKLPTNDVLWWKRLSHAANKWTPPGQRLLIVTAEGRVVGAQHQEMKVVRNFLGISSTAHTPQKKRYDNIELSGPFSVADKDEEYQLYFLHPATSAQSTFVNLLFDRPGLLLLVTLLISSPLLLWLAWSLARPARKLKLAADDVAKGHLILHPELESGPQEFQAAGSSFNKMIGALDVMATAQQRLISDISHELRTPLTRLQLSTALMRRRHGETPELCRIEIETQRLDSMIANLLELSRNQYKQKIESSSLVASDLWEEVLENAAFEADQKEKKLNVLNRPQPWKILGNANALESAIENIIRNAIRYSHTQIQVDFKADKQGVTIRVDDDGPGISAEDQKHIFSPFYRTDEARDRETGGTGLGLTIVAETIRNHHGWIKAATSPLGGFRIMLWLPLQSE